VAWVKPYGAVSREIFGYLSLALGDAAPMFEITLRELAEAVGLRYQPANRGPPPARPRPRD